MNKKVINILMLGSAILLAWCNSIKSSISFDTFMTEIDSDFAYKQVKVSDKSGYVKKVYTTENSGFQNSLVISKQTIETGNSIEFANENLSVLRKNIEKNGQITDSETITLECWENEIQASISSIEVTKWEKTRYITQLYFVNNKDGYTVSHLTEDNSEAKAAKKWLSKIQCSSK